jgi:hypothetical protein
MVIARKPMIAQYVSQFDEGCPVRTRPVARGVVPTWESRLPRGQRSASCAAA